MLFLSDGPDIREYAARLIPVPKRSRWDGIVHLHGCLPKDDEADALDRLVLTSGDFGLAYLVEGWATRFVLELFGKDDERFRRLGGYLRGHS